MTEHEYDRRYTAYQTDRSAFRKLVRRAYLTKARSYVRGRALDLGCGIGELLSSLPEGSKGLEYNRDTVQYCVEHGMDVSWYDGFADDWALGVVSRGDGFQTLIISHVLEHLADPMTILSKLLAAAPEKGIERLLIIVPGKAGYASDATHVTFVDEGMVRGALISSGWKPAHVQYFPGNLRRIGDRFAYHELQMLLVPHTQA